MEIPGLMKEGWKMSLLTTSTAGAVAVLMLGTLAACSGRRADDTAAAPVDTLSDSGVRSDTASPPAPDTAIGESGRPDVATPPIVPETQAARDTPPPGAAAPAAGGSPKVSKIEYEGWRQYSVNCARCHGQDVLPNPVAANLLVSLAPGGPIDTEPKFVQVVTEGRPERGMPAFKEIMSPEQTRAVYAYVKGRAEKRIPPGRPTSPT
jgi:mono/diheme cytochrome c family protein